jgi:undecaprenyl-diphosphatase
MPPAERSPSLRRAVALGLIQGPSELLPISSSAHTSLLPWLAGRDGPAPSGPRSRSLEVAMHGGGALALALEMAGPLRRELAPAGARGALSLALALAPPALAGLALRETIERRLSGPRASAAGLAVGALAMAAADRRGRSPERPAADLGPADGLALGLAQALALAPGVSRNGATLTAARARGFSRVGAQRLSWAAGLAVMGGAGAVEALGLARAGRRGGGAALAGGALAAFGSTRLSARLLRTRLERGALWPYSLYRCLLAALILRRSGSGQ